MAAADQDVALSQTCWGSFSAAGKFPMRPEVQGTVGPVAGLEASGCACTGQIFLTLQQSTETLEPFAYFWSCCMSC